MHGLTPLAAGAFQRLLAADPAVTPIQITGNVNDYFPPSLNATNVLRLSSDAARNVTGLAGGVPGRILLLLNVGSNTITLINGSSSSLPGNRFSLINDMAVPAGKGVFLWYDATTTAAGVWRAISGIANTEVTLAKIANASANSKLLGSGSAGSGAAYSEITLGTGLSMSSTTLSASGGTAASQATMEAATDTTDYVTAGRTQYHPGVAKAWSETTVSGGSPTNAASYNVSSITDNGVGDFTYNFSTSFSSTSYCCATFGADTGSGGGLRDVFGGTNYAKNTGSCRLRFANGAYADIPEGDVVFFGDQ